MNANPITILGAGPAGSSAAIAALREGSPVRLVEKSKFPRHKVCGEFLSPEIERELEQLDGWDDFTAAHPARIRRLALNFGRRKKESRLAEGAWGLSRYAFDAMLLHRALAAGAELGRDAEVTPTIHASGRQASRSRRGRRLFGFKAHFEGPVEDAVELFFFGGCYVGLNPIENGRTNLCGLAPEDFLGRFDFEYDEVVRQSGELADRLRPLRRAIGWVSTGPLEFRQNFTKENGYAAGDALSFVDPFTGTGLIAAVKTGSLAGVAAARRTPVSEYLDACRASLTKPFAIAEIFRKALNSGLAEVLVPLVPARILFAMTRPK